MPTPEKLTEAQIDALLARQKDWSLVGDAIQRTYTLPSFVTAIQFVDQVALAAEAAQHHPDILIRYTKVTLTLATHDAGGITTKDFTLASQCDGLAAKLTPAPPVPAAAPKAPRPPADRKPAPKKAPTK